MILWSRQPARGTTALGMVLAAPLVAVVGYSRVALGKHHLSDVLAGHWVGGLWLAFSVVIARRRLRRRKA